MQDASYHVDGKIIDIETNKETEYSDQLRKLVKRCIEPEPADRIGLNNLRAEIKAYRDRMSELYRRMSDTAKADFESEDRLYYIRNEINDMPTGSWEPYISSTPPEFEDDHFRDRSYPIIFPRFEDGPETKGGNDGDSDHDHDGDGDDVDKGDVQRARKPEAAKRTPPGSMSPRLLDPLFSDSSHQPPSLSLANSITDAIHSLGVSRSNNPIVVSSKIVNQSSGSSDIRPRRRARQAPYTQLRRGGAGDGGAGDGSLGDGGRASTRRGKDAIVPGVAAAREDGGIEGLEDRLTDGQASWAPSDGTDDGSQDMALESEDPVSPPPFGSRVLAPAPVPQAPLQPQPQPQPQPVPRRLRSGTTFGYF